MVPKAHQFAWNRTGASKEGILRSKGLELLKRLGVEHPQSQSQVQDLAVCAASQHPAAILLYV